MRPYAELNKEELGSLIRELKAEYKKYQAMELSLNMSRGFTDVLTMIRTAQLL